MQFLSGRTRTIISRRVFTCQPLLTLSSLIRRYEDTSHATLSYDRQALNRIGFGNLIRAQSFSTKMENQRLDEILQQHSTRKYFIEYNKFLSNHLAHGIIALQRLGADEQRIKKFIDWYTPRLESAEDHANEQEIPRNIVGKIQHNGKPHENSVIVEKIKSGDFQELEGGKITDDVMLSLVGKRSAYYAILQWYQRQLREDLSGDVDALIRKRFPAVVAGFAGSALHGLIHMGYGYAAKNSRLICEGLAYTHYSYVPFNSAESRHLNENFLQSLGRGSLDITQVVDEISANTELQDFIHQEIKKPEYQTLETSDFQRAMRALFTHKADLILDYMERVKFPSYLNISLPSNEEKDQLAKWIVDSAVTVYALCERQNDFFLIHGVTATYSLRQVLSAFDLSNWSDRLAVLQSSSAALYTLLAAYITQGAHRLIAFEAGSIGELESKSWEKIVAVCTKEERDEHVYKLVQVCFELQQETQDKNLQKIYKRAASRAIEYPLVF